MSTRQGGVGRNRGRADRRVRTAAPGRALDDRARDPRGPRPARGDCAQPRRRAAEVLARHVSNDVNWRIATVTETRLDRAGSGVEIIDLARKWKLKEGWDLVICLTDLPLRIDGRPVVADASASHGVALISIPALGPAGVQRRVRKTIVRLVDGLMGERLVATARTPGDAAGSAGASSSSPGRSNV